MCRVNDILRENDYFSEECSHVRSVLYFVESIYRRNDPTVFLSVHCSSYEDYKSGLCESNRKLPMGESLQKPEK